jgi:peptidoglycan DL-endopeptidase CwlO
VLLTASPSRRAAAIAALLALSMTLAAAPTGPVGATPAAQPGGSADDEGGTPTLREVLEVTARGYLEAKAQLNASKKRQVQLNARLRSIEGRLDALSVEVGAVASVAYRSGRLGPVSALLASRSPDAFLARAQAVELMAHRDNAQLRELTRLRTEYVANKRRIDAEVAEQAKQVKIMKRRQDDAERALVAVGGTPTGGFVSATSPLAKPAPRNADGSWPKESCIIDDPTTTSCVTPRTLHAYKQARADGFRRFANCHRTGGGGEHPKGRACDFSAQVGGFGGTATGGDRRYGNDLAAYFVRNSDRLGVLYVIWFRQIWFPGSGWRSYSGANGDPSSDHENHVHLSLL